MNHVRAVQGLIGVNLITGVWSYAVDGITPSWVVYPLLLLVGLVLVRRSVAAAAAYIGGLAAVFTLMHVPFAKAAVSADCVHPADPSLPCHPATWLATLAAVPAATAVMAGYLWWRARRA